MKVDKDKYVVCRVKGDIQDDGFDHFVVNLPSEPRYYPPYPPTYYRLPYPLPHRFTVWRDHVLGLASWFTHEAEEVVSAWAQRTEGVVTDIDGSRWDFIHDQVFAAAWERTAA